MYYDISYSANERLSFSSPNEYPYLPPPVEGEDVFIPGLPWLVEDVVPVVVAPLSFVKNMMPIDILPSVHHEPLFVKGGVAVYVSRGRAFRNSAPSTSPWVRC